MPPALLLILGLLVLTAGAELLVRGAAALALRLGLTPLVVGLTVVAFGTSAPELVVSLQAAQRGSLAIAVGNVVGSNLCNLALILGLCAVIRPLTAHRAVIRREVPLLIGATVIGAAMLLDDHLSRIEGAILAVGLVAYTWTTIRSARCAPDIPGPANPVCDLAVDVPKPLPLALAFTFGLIGLGLLLQGSDWFVEGAVSIARSWGWSETVIGLTVVAIGTSLPELATSLVAVKNGQNDVAVGNVVGSCIFNLLGILGVTGLLGSDGAAHLTRVDLWLLIGVTVALLPLVRSGSRISRGEGAALLLTYLSYTAWLILRT